MYAFSQDAPCQSAGDIEFFKTAGLLKGRGGGEGGGFNHWGSLEVFVVTGTVLSLESCSRNIWLADEISHICTEATCIV